MSTELLEVETKIIPITKTCTTCDNSDVVRHITGMIHMICKLNGEGKHSFSFCSQYCYGGEYK